MGSEPEDEFRFSSEAPQRRDAYPELWDGCRILACANARGRVGCSPEALLVGGRPCPLIWHTCGRSPLLAAAISAPSGIHPWCDA